MTVSTGGTVGKGSSVPELYILRHGQTVWNAEGRMQGWGNSPLTPKGEMHAARQGEILRDCDLDGFTAISSPSGRAIQTAAIALGTLVADINTDNRLREVGVGDWQGLTRGDLPELSADLTFIQRYDLAPGGEGLAALRLRCADFLGDLDGPAVLITHGITSRMIRSLIVGDHTMDATTEQGGQGVVWHLRDGQQHLLR